MELEMDERRISYKRKQESLEKNNNNEKKRCLKIKLPVLLHRLKIKAPYSFHYNSQKIPWSATI